jgi:GNAT superfamily N-acetyltransferase
VGQEAHRLALIIRPFQPSDSPEVGRLFHTTVHTVNRRDYTPQQLAAWAPEVPPPEHWAGRAATRRIFVAEEAGAILGFGELRTLGAYLDCLYTRHDAQGRGVATALVAAIETEARKIGLPRLHTDASITARAFFERRGFALIAPQSVVVRGVTLTNFRMQKELTSADQSPTTETATR